MPSSYKQVSRLFFAFSLAVLCPNSGDTVDRNFTSVTVDNTTTATSIYSFTVPANLLSTARGVRIYVWGTYQQNSGANRTLTVRVNLGAQTLLQDNSTNVVDANGTVGNFSLDAVVMNAGATNAQRSFFRFLWDRGAGTPVFLDMVASSTTGTVDTTVDQTLSVTVQHSNANAAITLTKNGALATLL